MDWFFDSRLLPLLGIARFIAIGAVAASAAATIAAMAVSGTERVRRQQMAELAG